MELILNVKNFESFEKAFKMLNEFSEDEKTIALCLAILENRGVIEIVKKNGKVDTISSTADNPIPDYKEIVNLFNEICGKKLPQITVLSANRKKAIRSLLKTFSQEQIFEAFKAVKDSDFLTGENSRKWKATFDWIIKEQNMAKILDGNYTTERDRSFASYDLDLFEKMLDEKMKSMDCDE